MISFELAPGKKILVKDLISIQALDKSFFGTELPGKRPSLELTPEEALYLIDVRGAACERKGKEVSFNELAAKFQGRKFLARYYCYRDWRNHGLIARPTSEAKEPYGKSPVVNYPAQEFVAPKIKSKGLFFYDDLMSVIDNDEEGKELYERWWFGQLGTYKARKHGRFLKLDAYETLFLMKHAGFKLNVNEKRVLKEALKRRKDFLSLYEVYEDWRLRGYILKTGFKFGTHFRLYFPGALPTLVGEEWIHSRHAIHVFPRESKLLISEWSRAIRVAHGVKKTFILAIPGVRKKPAGELDFLLYYRKKEGPENPKEDQPRYAMLALSEEEQIGGEELSSSLESARRLGLGLMLAICDRETAVTYYKVKRVRLPKSSFEYYEIEWTQP